MAANPPQPALKKLDELFKAEPDRLSRLSHEVAGLYFDWSKTHLEAELIEQSIARAEKMGFAKARDALFSGAVVNPSEDRPATHIAERGSGAPEDVDLATARHQRTRALVDAFYQAAMAAGGRDNGGPGLRPHYHEKYYGAFVLDPDGNNIEACCHV